MIERHWDKIWLFVFVSCAGLSYACDHWKKYVDVFMAIMILIVAVMVILKFSIMLDGKKS